MPGHYHNKRSSLLGKQPKPSARTVKERKVIRNLIKTGASKGKSTPALMRLLSPPSQPNRIPNLKIGGMPTGRNMTWTKKTRAGRAMRSVVSKGQLKTRKNLSEFRRRHPNYSTSGLSKDTGYVREDTKIKIGKALRVAGPLGVALTLFDFLKGKPAH